MHSDQSLSYERTISLGYRRSIAVLACVIILFPKFNLADVSGQSAGIRADDFLTILLLGLILGTTALTKELLFSKTIVPYILFALYGFVPALINILLYGRGSFLYPLRFLEYSTFFFAGCLITIPQLVKLCWTILLVNTIVSFLQLAGLVGAFTSAGFVTSTAERVMGVTGGPWEMGAVINLLYCALALYSKRLYGLTRQLLFFALCCSLIFLTAARTPLAAVLISGFWLFILSFRKTSTAVGMATICSSVFLFATYYWAPLINFDTISANGEGVLDRSANLFTFDNLYSLSDYLKFTQVDQNLSSYGTVYLDPDLDQSWNLRLNEWAYALKIWTYDSLNLSLGIGPGAFGTSVDGGWLRLACEYGPFGLLLYLAFLRRTWKLGTLFKMMNVSFAINLIMIDIFMSSKFMALYLITVGALVRSRHPRWSSSFETKQTVEVELAHRQSPAPRPLTQHSHSRPSNV